jgi:hypothetical protein
MGDLRGALVRAGYLEKGELICEIPAVTISLAVAERQSLNRCGLKNKVVIQNDAGELKAMNNFCALGVLCELCDKFLFKLRVSNWQGRVLTKLTKNTKSTTGGASRSPHCCCTTKNQVARHQGR